MSDDERRKRHVSIAVAVFFGAGMPGGLWTILNYLRPDLVGAMLDHHFGYLLTLAEYAWIMIGTGLYVTAAAVRFDRSWPRYLLNVTAFFLFTLPLLFAILFGPIVFAFMFGDVPPR